jgi:hypothetical protein
MSGTGGINTLLRGPAQLPYQVINSLTGSNLGGLGGVSNNSFTQLVNGTLGTNLNNAGNPAINAANAASQAANPQTLPNLGASSMLPITPQGGFSPVNTSQGGINAMANQSAGQLFNPAMQQNATSPFFQNPGNSMPIGNSGLGSGAKGLNGISGMNLPSYDPIMFGRG